MKGVQGNLAAQVRMFAHDAVSLVTGGGTLTTSTISGTDNRGVCLYIGAAMTSITVTMESGTSVTFKGIQAGSFLPILVTAVTAATGEAALADNDILGLY
jgi:hypothetical protein